MDGLKAKERRHTGRDFGRCVVLHSCHECPANALTLWWWEEGDDESYLCGHHSDEKAKRRVDIGWVLIEDMRVEAIA